MPISQRRKLRLERVEFAWSHTAEEPVKGSGGIRCPQAGPLTGLTSPGTESCKTPPLCTGLGTSGSTCYLSLSFSPSPCSSGVGAGVSHCIGSRLTPGARCTLLLWGVHHGAASLPTLALPVGLCHAKCSMTSFHLQPSGWSRDHQIH